MEKYLLIKIDDDKRIIQASGRRPLAKNEDDCIKVYCSEKEYFKYAAMLQRFNGLVNSNGIYLYKYEDGKIIKRSDEEIAEDKRIQDLIPTQLDIIEAQVTYTAMLTDTLLEV